MPIPNAILPPSSLILVTGANGYIGSHVVDQALKAGYRVRGTVRDTNKAAWVQKFFDDRYGSGKFELVTVKDMAVEGAFDEAVKGVAGIAHVAATVNPDLDPNKSVTPVIRATEYILDSAAKEPSVKRFVLTSSSVAASLPRPNVEFEITEKSWNEESVTAAWTEPYDDPSHGWDVYAASKTQSEQAMWKWAEERKPGFVVNAVLPNANFGKILDPKNQGFPSTAGWAAGMFTGEHAEKIAMGIKPQYFVNVQDVALLHIIALVHPDVQNERIFAFAAPFNWNDILAAYRQLFPERKFVGDFPDVSRDLSTVERRARAEALLKEAGLPGFMDLKESLRDTVESLL